MKHWKNTGKSKQYTGKVREICQSKNVGTMNIHVWIFLQIVYGRGAEAYNSEDWEGTIKHMEAAIVEYIEEYERCELLCEGRYDHEAFPELYNSIAGNCLTFMIANFACMHASCFSSTAKLKPAFAY